MVIGRWMIFKTRSTEITPVAESSESLLADWLLIYEQGPRRKLIATRLSNERFGPRSDTQLATSDISFQPSSHSIGLMGLAPIHSVLISAIVPDAQLPLHGHNAECCGETPIAIAGGGRR